jgi:hypothetical protein
MTDDQDALDAAAFDRGFMAEHRRVTAQPYADLTGADDEDDGGTYFRGLDRLDDQRNCDAAR